MGKDMDLLHAVQRQELSSVQKILGRNKSKLIGASKKANVNFQDQDGMSGLHQTALAGNVDIMKILIDHGAKPDLKDIKGMRAIHYASWQGNVDPVAMLLKSGSDANEAAYEGQTPLHLACEHGHYDVVARLLSYHGDPTRINHQHKTPFDMACEHGRERVVELLLESRLCHALLQDSSEDMADSKRATCIHLAARNGHSNVINLLLQAGIDINRETQTGTCLHEAVIHGKADVVNFLLKCGIDVHKPNAYGQTALDIADRLPPGRAGVKDIKHILKEATCLGEAVAVRNYNNMTQHNHLQFNEGDYVKVVEKHPSGMWKGYVISNGNQVSKPGYFPANCVLLLETKGCKNMSGCCNNYDARSPLGVMPPDLIAKHPCHHNHAALIEQKRKGGRQFSSQITIGTDDSFPPPPSPKSSPANFFYPDADRDSGISPQQGYPPGPLSSPQGVRQHSPHNTAERTAEWLGRYVSVAHSDGASVSPSSSSPASSNRNSITSTNSGGYVSNHYVSGGYQGSGYPHAISNGCQGNHRLSGQSLESSGVSSARQSYHSGSSSSLGSLDQRGSLDRLEESAYSSSINVHELFAHGYPDHEVLRAWLTELHLEEYYKLFIHAGYDMPTISRMTPEDLTAIGVTKPAHRKRLKQEISKLHIHDGIPHYKPATVVEWLRLLCLDEYAQALDSQGYEAVETLTDITWEDLEEIGVKRLGHQKKMMLAIDRLRRIEKGQYKPPPPDNYRGSHELLNPHAPHTHRGVSPGACPSPSNHHGAPYAHGDYITHKPPRSPSMDNIMNQNRHPLADVRTDGRTYASREDIYSRAKLQQQSHYQTPRINSSVDGNSAGVYAHSQDIVAIQVHRPANSTPTQEVELVQNSSQLSPHKTHTSFQSPIRTRHASGPGSTSGEMHQNSSGYDRGAISGDELDSYSSGTLSRPSARISPLPKPKPVMRGTYDLNSAETSKSSDFSQYNGHHVSLSKNYSSGSLPRNASLRNKATIEHIYDVPANAKSRTDGQMHQPVIRPSLGSAPSSPHHSASFFSTGAGINNTHSKGSSSKKAPPPPPKRTNSIKAGSHLPNKPVHPALKGLAKSEADGDNVSTGIPSDEESHPPPPQAMPLLSNNYGVVTDRFGRLASPSGSHKNSVDSLGSNSSDKSKNSSLSDNSDGSPQHSNRLKNSSDSSQRYPYPNSDMPSPLTHAIQQLQDNASGLKNSSHGQNQNGGANQFNFQSSQRNNVGNDSVEDTQSNSKPTIAEKPKHPKPTDWSERDIDSSGSGSDSDSSRQNTLKRATSTGTVDSNTLPFANENVGTIKQRNATAKPSIVSVSSSDGVEGDGERNVELNSSVFEDFSNGTDFCNGTDTIRRGASMKQGPTSQNIVSNEFSSSSSQHLNASSNERSKVAPPAPLRQDSVGASAQNQANGRSGDVLNDIGNMLQDLTDELDAMLDNDIDI